MCTFSLTIIWDFIFILKGRGSWCGEVLQACLVPSGQETSQVRTGWYHAVIPVQAPARHTNSTLP